MDAHGEILPETLELAVDPVVACFFAKPFLEFFKSLPENGIWSDFSWVRFLSNRSISREAQLIRMILAEVMRK
jgi:hypothetical protein